MEAPHSQPVTIPPAPPLHKKFETRLNIFLGKVRATYDQRAARADSFPASVVSTARDNNRFGPEMTIERFGADQLETIVHRAFNSQERSCGKDRFRIAVPNQKIGCFREYLEKCADPARP